MRCFLPSVLTALFVLCLSSPGQCADTPTTVRTDRLLKLFDESLDMAEFQNPMTLKEALGLIHDHMKAKGQVPIFVDTEAFKAENPDAPDIYDTQVKYPPYPKSMTMGTALRYAISKIPNGGTLLVRDGAIWVTARPSTGSEHLLKQNIIANYDKARLADVLADLSAQTGATIILDQRLAKRDTIISANFRSGITLSSALTILADMADAKLAVLPDALYLTSPERATAMAHEDRLRNLRERLEKLEREK